MKDFQRRYPLFSLCGLNCGLCPMFHSDGISKCPGCGGKDFCCKHPACAIITCSKRYGEMEYCYLCGQYPCKKYEGADLYDSFIVHRNQLKDIAKAQSVGMAAYQLELNEKVRILEHLLQNYNDGRRKSFFCIAVNLLDLEDIKAVLSQIEHEVKKDAPLKERAEIAVGCFQRMAQRRNVILKLNKKNK